MLLRSCEAQKTKRIALSTEDLTEIGRQGCPAMREKRLAEMSVTIPSNEEDWLLRVKSTLKDGCRIAIEPREKREVGEEQKCFI